MAYMYSSGSTSAVVLSEIQSFIIKEIDQCMLKVRFACLQFHHHCIINIVLIIFPQSRKSSESKTPTESEFDEDESEELEDGVKITVGVCAMNKKVWSLNIQKSAPSTFKFTFTLSKNI